MLSSPGSLAWTSSTAGAGRVEVTPRLVVVLLLLILAIAVVLRLIGLFHDLPYSYFGDENAIVNRAMAMGTGDLNPHRFVKPAFMFYLLLAAYGAFFVVGWLFGQFASPEAFGAYFMTERGAFLLIGRLLVAGFGVASVYVTYLLARRAFGSVAGALCAALVAAVLLPMVVGSHHIKEDVPAGFFVALAAYFYLRTREDTGFWPLLLAGAAAGLAMGTKYYGVIIVPVVLMAEAARWLTHGETLTRVTLRGTVFVAAFVGAFFIASPYHFLDPSFARSVIAQISRFIAPDEGAVIYAIDSHLEYQPGVGSVPGALAFALRQTLQWSALGWSLAVLVVLGMVHGLVRRETRWATLMVAGPALIFIAVAATLQPYHADARHLNAIYPLLIVFVYPGALLLVQALRLGTARAVSGVAVALVLLAAAPTAALSVAENIAKLRPDSRTVAARWIETHLPRDELILLDSYGPVLAPGPVAVARQRERFELLAAPDAYSAQEGRRLAVMERHPVAGGFNVERLGHQWWLPREVSQEELETERSHRIDSPFVDRVPRTLAEYRAEGFRYIITSTEAQAHYLPGSIGERGFPSFVRFYDELAQLEPLMVFDPASWGGRGPVVFIYDLQHGADLAAGG